MTRCLDRLWIDHRQLDIELHIEAHHAAEGYGGVVEHKLLLILLWDTDRDQVGSVQILAVGSCDQADQAPYFPSSHGSCLPGVCQELGEVPLLRVDECQDPLRQNPNRIAAKHDLHPPLQPVSCSQFPRAGGLPVIQPRPPPPPAPFGPPGGSPAGRLRRCAGSAPPAPWGAGNIISLRPDPPEHC